MPASHRERVLELVRARYADFGPTLAREKLLETLRKWMTEDGLWVPHARRRDRVQQPRKRRTCMGELIQIDGCDHEWFEERADRCASGTVVARSNSSTQTTVNGNSQRYTLVSKESGLVRLDLDNPPCEAPLVILAFPVSVAASN